ncbi:hypothetical protein [Amycolatopsis alba]|uniref:Uncharacterized protein n=1 Tax=Amycolatopsis alba DSM 44262 TaxID=1125972 RepID=A0A229R838_AMYAL|nr:hypothetical protein [Amycolatopsis alba]OXM42796.1 hypothetical protein CFP75_41375 [Amycolatopsis alba DSM 44262]
MSEFVARVSTLSTTGLFAASVFSITVFFGIWLVLRPFRAKVKSVGRIRIKALFFEIEIGPPSPEDTEDEISEQQPPAKDAPKIADSDPPS